jgi:RNA polymerase sigma-70 factor (ECF subfamily)
MNPATSSLPLNQALSMEDARRADVSPISALTRRMAAAEESAFRDFHAVYFARLFRYVIVLMRGDEHAARDVVQETLLRIVRHARPFDDEKHFWDWLALLARSAAADHGRRSSRYQRLLAAFGGQPDRQPEVAPDDEMNLDSVMDEALATLSGPERELLAQKYGEGMSVRELAGAGGVSEEAIESRLARARRTLRQAAFRLMRRAGKEPHHERS